MTDLKLADDATTERDGIVATLFDWLRIPSISDAPTVLVDGELKAGAIDDKVQVLYQVEAARGTLRQAGRLPIDLKFLVEGEEEVGSTHFEALPVDLGAGSFGAGS